MITLVWMFVINPKLAATCFVVVPAIVYASRIFGDYMRTLSTETQDSLAEANSVAEEVVAAISTTRCHAAEAEEQRRYAIGMDKYVKCCVRTARIYFLYSSLTYTFLPYATYCLVLYYGAQLTNTPAGCTSKGDHCGTAGNPPCCEMDGAGLISFVLYMQSLFASFNGPSRPLPPARPPPAARRPSPAPRRP